MCTYNIVLNDSLVEKAQSAFHSKEAVIEWLQIQAERMLRQMVEVPEERPLKKVVVSDRIRSLSNVEATAFDSDYKENITNILSAKYGN